MQRSTDHFLSSHVGSLPREKDLMDMMWAKEDCVPVDQSAMKAAEHEAVLGIAGRQQATGINASPGVTSIFFKNEYYKTHEEYVFEIADAMEHEYEAIAKSGATLQIDCPELAMGRHMTSKGVSLEDFRERVSRRVEVLNHAVANIPSEQLRMHLC